MLWRGEDHVGIGVHTIGEQLLSDEVGVRGEVAKGIGFSSDVDVGFVLLR